MGPQQTRKTVTIPLIVGSVLTFAGMLSLVISIGEWGPGPGDLAIDWVFIPMLLLSGTIVIFAIFIAKGHRLADKSPYLITASFILMIPFSYLGTPDSMGFYGSDRAWAVIMGVFQTLLCGGISFLPMLLSKPNTEEVPLGQ